MNQSNSISEIFYIHDDKNQAKILYMEIIKAQHPTVALNKKSLHIKKTSTV